MGAAKYTGLAMVKRMKYGPVNAATVLPAPLVKALQQVVAGRHVYIPAVESPVARRWREARQYRQLDYSVTDIAMQLEIEPRAVTRLLAAPSPPNSRAVAAHFDTPKTRAILLRIQHHVEACVLYVPTAVSKVELRRRRIYRLFTLGWTPSRVATHLMMNARYVDRLFQSWQTLKESEGIIVVPGHPLHSAEDRRRDADQRQRQRSAEKVCQTELARQCVIFGDEEIEQVSVHPVPLD